MLGFHYCGTTEVCKHCHHCNCSQNRLLPRECFYQVLFHKPDQLNTDEGYSNVEPVYSGFDDSLSHCPPFYLKTPIVYFI